MCRSMRNEEHVTRILYALKNILRAIRGYVYHKDDGTAGRGYFPKYERGEYMDIAKLLLCKCFLVHVKFMSEDRHI